MQLLNKSTSCNIKAVYHIRQYQQEGYCLLSTFFPIKQSLPVDKHQHTKKSKIKKKTGERKHLQGNTASWKPSTGERAEICGRYRTLNIYLMFQDCTVHIILHRKDLRLYSMDLSFI